MKIFAAALVALIAGYMLGAWPLQSEVARLEGKVDDLPTELKNREKDKPTAILVGSMSQAERYGDFNDVARDLVAKYWPGALTIVVPAKKGVNKKILNNKKNTRRFL